MTSTLLAKFIIKGLELTKAPWKFFLSQHINNLEPCNSKNWHKGKNWLFFATNIKPQGSPLWDAIWKAYCLIRKGILPLNFKKFSKFLR